MPIAAPYSPLQLGWRYLNYYATALNSRGHGIHSPFVYAFVRNLLMDRKQYPEYRKVESLRTALLADHTMIDLTDFGAGSGAQGNRRKQRSVSAIAGTAAKPARLGQVLFRSVRYFRPATILELGSSLGITTSYLAAGAPEARLISIEGDPALALRAARNLSDGGYQRAGILSGSFEERLPEALATLEKLDFVFVDGNHRLEPTLRYLEQILPHTHPDTVLVFDDIHWSAEMEAAWQIIREHPAVTGTIDLFFLGFVFFRKEFRQRQHFPIRFR
jgi:predicted O-methyltransferase YrrM